MKILLVVAVLLAVNVLWFWMLAAMRRHGYAVSYVNFLTDLKSFHLLIVDTKAAHERHVLTFALIGLYVLVAALAGAAVLSILL